MRRNKILLAGCLGAVATLAAFLLIRARCVVDAKLLRVQGFPDVLTTNQNHPWPCFTFRITKADSPFLQFAEEQQVQYRIGGQWLAPEAYTGPFETVQGLPGCGQVASIPNRRGAEAFRVHLTWRRQSPRDEAEVLLVRLANRGWKLPKVCSRLYPLLPKERMRAGDAGRRWQRSWPPASLSPALGDFAHRPTKPFYDTHPN
jgi:hypothetical protein